MFTGPGEVIFMTLIVLGIKAMFGLSSFISAFSVIAPHLTTFLSALGKSIAFSPQN